jgi:Na+/H+ antiporter NhaD/arsenite permease-like protein
MELNVLGIIPFILLLLSLAIVPIISFKWWDRNYYYFPLVFSVVTLIYLLSINRGSLILRSMGEYVEFISILTSLYVISGGIYIGIKGYATPLRNVIFLLMGSLLSNIIGTTGASVLLIRPFIQSNKSRIAVFHIIFFIFLISNIGGALTPIGDPPLFLGYLKGIPFFWIIGKVFIPWLITITILLIIFYILDRNSFKKLQSKEQTENEGSEKIGISGLYNLIFLIIVIISVFIKEPRFLREIIILLSAYGSYKLANPEIHKKNNFSSRPIVEVIFIFFGVFITMAPALELLRMYSHEINISSPSKIYWLTGFLSSILDSAPTYLTFLTTCMGYIGLDVNNLNHVQFFISDKEIIVISISISAVFFGAMTYIGNVPNYIVKSIAESEGIKMSGFFGYIIKYSIPILLPIFVFVWLLFIL